MPNPQKDIIRLRNEIVEHDRLYYKDAQPEIDDQTYDRLKVELAQLEVALPEFSFDTSPTQSVGDDRLDAFESYRHRKPMLSLDNTYNTCLLYTSPSPRDVEESRMPSSA